MTILRIKDAECSLLVCSLFEVCQGQPPVDEFSMMLYLKGMAAEQHQIESETHGMEGGTCWPFTTGSCALTAQLDGLCKLPPYVHLGSSVS